MIPEFLKPPTDNLYKFMTIVGLILFLISISYPPWLYHRSQMAVFDAERDAELLQLERDDLNEKYRRVVEAINRETDEYNAQSDRIKELTKQTRDDKLSAKQRTAMTQEIAEMHAKNDANEKQRNSLNQVADEAADKVKKNDVELKYKLRINIWESWYGRIAMLVCLLGSVVGLIIGRKGFNLWSLRVQVYQDAILIKEAEVIENPQKKPEGS